MSTRFVKIVVLLVMFSFLVAVPADAQKHKEGYLLHKDDSTGERQLFYYHIVEDSTVFVRKGRSEDAPSLGLPPFVFQELVRSFEEIGGGDSIQVTRKASVSFREGRTHVELIARSLLLVGFMLALGGCVFLFVRVRKQRRRRKQQRATREHLAQGREKERSRLARELHDGPVQDLHALRLYVDALPPENSDQAQEIEKQLLQVVRELRAVSEDLRPPSLSSFGLAAALRSLAENVEERFAGVTVDLDLTEDADVLSEREELTFFRIGQEAANNAVQHGEATHLRMRLRATREQALLEVRDDGGGFEVPDDWNELAQEGHYGLFGMAERAELIGADLQVESSPGEGTVVQFSLPAPSGQ